MNATKNAISGKKLEQQLHWRPFLLTNGILAPLAQRPKRA